ncbi:MAG: tRNA 2-thiocytidine biosynthesis protein TtcA [Parachlamydiaceae bacterium]|nr:tRNA 2-thiocytidine biosynthesis protein TtcA [Parachlamydiaceae bacterium]
MELPIARPPWTGLGKKIESATRKALYDYKMLEDPLATMNSSQPTALAVALSGGKDSLALLFMLKAILGRGFPLLDLHAIHVSGAYTCGAGVSLDYLRGICEKLEVNFIVKEAHQKLEDLECYSCSRTRRTLLFEAAKEVNATTIAFGHHRDDHVQTLLMNLLHKGEFAGNLPKITMHDYGVTIIRPLIYISEQEIKSFAKQQNFLRITCQCPVGQNSMRKQVDNLMNDIENLFPNARANLASAGLLYGSTKASQK